MPTLVAHLLRARLRGWRLWGAAALVLLQPAVSVLRVLTGPTIPGAQAGAQLLSDVAGGGLFLGTAMVMVSASTLRDERDDHTLGYLVLKPLPRWHVAMAAVAAGIGACLALAIVATAGLTVAGLVVGAGLVGAQTLAYTVAAAVGYGAVSTVVGYLAPRGLMAMLFYVFVWEGLAGTLIPLAGNTSLWRISLSAWGSITELSALTTDLMAPIVAGAGGAGLKLAGTVAVITLLLWQLLDRRDLV